MLYLYQQNKQKQNIMKATHIYTEKFDTNRKLANRALKAMSDLQDYDNGTIRNPNDLASTIMKDGRTLIQTIYEDGYVRFADGYNIVEVDDYTMYVDVVDEVESYICDAGLEPCID